MEMNWKMCVLFETDGRLEPEESEEFPDVPATGQFGRIVFGGQRRGRRKRRETRERRLLPGQPLALEIIDRGRSEPIGRGWGRSWRLPHSIPLAGKPFSIPLRQRRWRSAASSSRN